MNSDKLVTDLKSWLEFTKEYYDRLNIVTGNGMYIGQAVMCGVVLDQINRMENEK